MGCASSAEAAADLPDASPGTVRPDGVDVLGQSVPLTTTTAHVAPSTTPAALLSRGPLPPAPTAHDPVADFSELRSDVGSHTEPTLAVVCDNAVSMAAPHPCQPTAHPRLPLQDRASASGSAGPALFELATVADDADEQAPSAPIAGAGSTVVRGADLPFAGPRSFATNATFGRAAPSGTSAVPMSGSRFFSNTYTSILASATDPTATGIERSGHSHHGAAKVPPKRNPFAACGRHIDDSDPAPPADSDARKASELTPATLATAGTERRRDLLSMVHDWARDVDAAPDDVVLSTAADDDDTELRPDDPLAQPLVLSCGF
uniref:Uncharacterized protein n=1 Tax=Neobodo designis TaxID=312471 RepID=A0A7S1QAQ1_NEODS|mmetsp:Transcript_3692/g.11664  ORF Transcript_3692/g.11664 Transcript_3692/m.11664 type:complete len:319 (+) Transcript_3692:270-1226(+)